MNLTTFILPHLGWWADNAEWLLAKTSNYRAGSQSGSSLHARLVLLSQRENEAIQPQCRVIFFYKMLIFRNDFAWIVTL